MPKSKPEDVAAAQAIAEAPGMVPGAPAALPGRLHGRYATALVYRGTPPNEVHIVLDLFDWEVSFEMETFDATAHGEYWKVHVQGDQSWRARARGYFRASQSPYLTAAGDRTPSDPLMVRFTGYDGVTQNNNTRVFQGDGFITRANFSAPMAMVEQELEITGSGVPLNIGLEP